MDLKIVKEFVIEIAKEVGRYQLDEVSNFKSCDALDNNIGLSTKQDASDHVSIVDKESEKRIVSKILEKYPDHNIIGEENTYRKTSSPYKWFIDPIDGTSNFIRGIPMWSISIGLVHDNIPVLGVVHIPYLNDTYHAFSGDGAFKTSTNPITGQSQAKQIHVSRRTNLVGGLYTMGFIFEKDKMKPLSILEELFKINRDMRRMGSAAINLCYLAQGSFDLFFQTRLSPYDYMAGQVLVKEAGGILTDLEGVPNVITDSGIIGCGTKEIHDLALKIKREHIK